MPSNVHLVKPMGVGLAGQIPTLPPLLDERPPLEELSLPGFQELQELLELRDEKLFQRLEDWLRKLEGTMSPVHASHISPCVSVKDSDKGRSSLIKAELEEKRRISETKRVSEKKRISEVASPLASPDSHRELRVAMGQLEDHLKEPKSWRETLLELLHKLVSWSHWNNGEGEVRNHEPNEDEKRGRISRALNRTVSSWMFEAFFALVILTNSVVIAVQVEELAQAPDAPPSQTSFVVNSIYTFLFTLELLLRILTRGFSIFCSPEWAWYILDVIVVSSSIFEFMLELALQQGGENNTNVFTNMRLLRILRIGRITRAIRIVRVVKFIRSLRALLYSIGHTLRAMVWSVVLLGLIIFLFGLIFTDISSEALAGNSLSGVHADFIGQRFSGLENSMHTLYASITQGQTWIEAFDAFYQVSRIYGYLFEAYIAFCLFAVLNVMTGVFCQSAMESAEKDHELVLQNVVQEKAKYFRAVRRLFMQLDKNADGGINQEEFESAINDPTLRSVFDALEINAADAWALWQQLDQDGNNHVDVEEFLEGCMILKGPARSIDVVCIKRDLMAVRSRFDQQATSLQEIRDVLERNARPSRSPKVASENPVGSTRSNAVE